MKKIALLLTIPALLFSYSAVAQNVGINETGNPADASAGLDVDFDDKGFLLPRVALTNTTNQAPIGAPANSLMVYNTATAGDVTPGYYYWNGTIWKRFAESGDAWKIEGNAGTNAGTNFLGTTDNNALRIRTNNNNRFEFTTNGRFRSFNGGTAGAPTYSWTASTGMGMYRSADNNLSFSTSGVEQMRIQQDGRIRVNHNLVAAGQLHVEANFTAGVGTDGSIIGKNTNANGIAIGGAGQNQTWNGLATGSGGSFVGFDCGIYANFTTINEGSGITIQDNLGAQWQVGHWTGGAYRKIIGNGTVNTIVKDLNDEYVVMTCPESPEVIFQDYGTGKLTNGKAKIEIDPILQKNILVDEDHPLKVFIQLEGECNGVYVTSKSISGFEVVELNNGSSNVSFSYEIIATRADETLTGPNGETRVSSYKGRFPKAPKLKERYIQPNDND